MFALAIAWACAGDQAPSGRLAHGAEIPPTLFGKWTIVDYAAPGVVALDERQIESHRGRTVEFSSDSAVYGTFRCLTPSYDSQTVRADSFFATGFLTTPDSAKVRPDSDDRLRITEVRCADKDWDSPIQQVYWSGADTITILEGGVFFLLRRN
jgi:hypothetical protein